MHSLAFDVNKVRVKNALKKHNGKNTMETCGATGVASTGVYMKRCMCSTVAQGMEGRDVWWGGNSVYYMFIKRQARKMVPTDAQSKSV